VLGSAQLSRADFVLRSELVPGATVLVEPAPPESEEEVTLSVIKPEKPAPVPVGGGEDDEPEAVDDTGALDTPPVPPTDES